HLRHLDQRVREAMGDHQVEADDDRPGQSDRADLAGIEHAGDDDEGSERQDGHADTLRAGPEQSAQTPPLQFVHFTCPERSFRPRSDQKTCRDVVTDTGQLRPAASSAARTDQAAMPMAMSLNWISSIFRSVSVSPVARRVTRNWSSCCRIPNSRIERS